MPLLRTEHAASAAPRSVLRGLASNLHWVFLLFAVPQVIFLALCTPPFQVADEEAHFERAWQVAHLRLGPQYGGSVDTSVHQLWNIVAGIPFHPDAHYTGELQIAAKSLQWSGQSAYQGFPNTGSGAPTGYLPQALGIVTSRAIGLGPWRTVQLARLLNGAFAIALCALALYWSRRGKLVMFALLLMPMSLSLFASCGQDATLIAAACLAFAMISRQLDVGMPFSRAQAAIVIVLLLVVLIGRPPYVVLLPVLLAPGLFQEQLNRRSWIRGTWLACLLFLVTVAWWFTAMHTSREVAQPLAGIGVVDAKLQLISLFHNPKILAGLLGYVAHHTNEYIVGVIGYLGWLDTPTPGLYNLAMFLVLVVAAVAEMARSSRISRSFTILSSLAFFAAVAAVFLVEYLIWTPVGASAIYGVQGRYFIPLLIAAAVGLPQLGNSEKAIERITAVVVAAQLITVFVLPQVIFARYYGA